MGRQKKLTCLSAVRVFSDGPADGEYVFHRHRADDAGDLRFALAAVPAKLVGSELAGGRIVPHVLGTDHEGPSVLYLTRSCFRGGHSSSGHTRSGNTSPAVWKPSEEAAPLPARAVVGFGFFEGELSKKRDMGRRSTEGVRGCACAYPLKQSSQRWYHLNSSCQR